MMKMLFSLTLLGCFIMNANSMMHSSDGDYTVSVDGAASSEERRMMTFMIRHGEVRDSRSLRSRYRLSTQFNNA
jgi:hypothetical protein